MKDRVGFIGLGHMGLPMAENVLRAGFPLCIYNRTKEKAVPLLDKGAVWFATPGELADSSDVVITMVANDHALNEIVPGILSSSKRPLMHISMSTVSPDLITDLEKKHQEKGISFLAAPVTGRPERAKEGTLWIFLAGDSKAKNSASAILKTMSTKIFDLGEEAAQASLFKLCNNFMILSLIEAFSEAASIPLPLQSYPNRLIQSPGIKTLYRNDFKNRFSASAKAPGDRRSRRGVILQKYNPPS